MMMCGKMGIGNEVVMACLTVLSWHLLGGTDWNLLNTSHEHYCFMWPAKFEYPGRCKIRYAPEWRVITRNTEMVSHRYHEVFCQCWEIL